MRLALVGWGSDTGVGMELRDAAKYLPVEATFLMPHMGRPIPDALASQVVKGYDLPQQMEQWLDVHKPDTILTWELPGCWDFPEIWRRRGIRWFSVVHWEWFYPGKLDAWRTARLIAPNELCRAGLQARYGLESALLAVPIDLERLPFRERTTADRFVSVYAQGGPQNRRSMPEILEAWKLMGTAAPQLMILAQKNPFDYLRKKPHAAGIGIGADLESAEHLIPSQVSAEIRNLQTPAELYQNADVAVQISRFEGVGLSLLEAQACGVPVITTAADPMRQIAPELLVDTDESFEAELLIGQPVEVHIPNPSSLAKRVSSLRGQDIRELSHSARARAETYAWSVLKDRWMELLTKP